MVVVWFGFSPFPLYDEVKSDGYGKVGLVQCRLAAVDGLEYRGLSPAELLREHSDYHLRRQVQKKKRFSAEAIGSRNSWPERGLLNLKWIAN